MESSERNWANISETICPTMLVFGKQASSRRIPQFHKFNFYDVITLVPYKELKSEDFSRRHHRQSAVEKVHCAWHTPDKRRPPAGEVIYQISLLLQRFFFTFLFGSYDFRSIDAQLYFKLNLRTVSAFLTQFLEDRNGNRARCNEQTSPQIVSRMKYFICV